MKKIVDIKEIPVEKLGRDYGISMVNSLVDQGYELLNILDGESHFARLAQMIKYEKSAGYDDSTKICETCGVNDDDVELNDIVHIRLNKIIKAKKSHMHECAGCETLIPYNQVYCGFYCGKTGY